MSAPLPRPINEHERRCPDCQRVIAEQREAARLRWKPAAPPSPTEE